MERKGGVKLDDLVNQTSEWLKATGPNSDIVMSSRIRLARNLSKFPFSHWADNKKEEEILETTRPAVLGLDYMKGAIFEKVADLSGIDRQFLLERHLVSREHIVEPNQKAIAVSDREVISIMINEEDHLRIQVIGSGFNLQDVWKIIDKVDNELSEKLNFAYSIDWGYLTACPTNTGTGIRASVMMHLPALVATKQINKVLHTIVKIGLTARGFYGEGTEATGNFFQISNQVTLGHSEEDIIDNIERIIRQVIEHEQQSRETLLGQNKEALQDRIYRAYGTLKSAFIMTSKEAIELLSAVRLGVDMGIIKEIDRRALNELFITIQPAHLQKLEGKNLTAPERDVKRANLIRGKLKGL